LERALEVCEEQSSQEEALRCIAGYFHMHDVEPLEEEIEVDFGEIP
jgi:hypothetical protein